MNKTKIKSEELLIPAVNTDLYYLIEMLKKTKLQQTLKLAENTYEIFEKELQKLFTEKTSN